MGLITVTKSTGLDEPFDEEKLRASLIRAGASGDLAERVTRTVRESIRQSHSTDSIRRVVVRALKREVGFVAARYDLKRAIIRLGPTGFPFERFWGALLTRLGFSVDYDVILRGRCIPHEIDVRAKRGAETRLAECKFHNKPGRCTDTRVALCTYARSLDLREHGTLELVTNTRFTSEALAYGRCVGLSLVSWDYPQGDSLRELVDRHALYPISCLAALKARQVRRLVELGVVLTGDLLDNPDRLEQLGLRASASREVLDEAFELERVGTLIRSANGHAPATRCHADGTARVTSTEHGA